MKLFVPVLCLLSSVLGDAADPVLTLTDETYSAFLKEHSLTLVEYYAPWCGHCKALKPEYEKASATLAELSSPITIAKVDCTVSNSICESEGVKGFPTLKIFHDGVSSEYKGQRTADSIVSIMKKQASPPVTFLDAESLKPFSSSDKVVLVAFLPSVESPEFKTFESVAKTLRDDFTFGTSQDASAVPEGQKTPALVLYRKFDTSPVYFAGEWTGEAISEFIASNSIPLVDDIGPENYAKYVERNLPIGFLFVSSPAEREKVQEDYNALAKSYQGKISFVFIDATKYGGHAGNLALEEGSWPAFAIENAGQKWPFDQSKDLTKENVTPFIESVLDGSLAPTLKSEPIPTQDDGDVKVVVGKSFVDVVLDKSKDVFIEFYAPWCGHCKSLAPVWSQLATKFADSPNVVIAKMDATANDVPAEGKIQIQGFPTLVLYKAETNEMVTYEGERKLDALIAFVSKNAANAEGDDVAPEPAEDEEDDVERDEL